ncbi:MAG: O-antigen ligase family protein [Kordiimonadaceae bacterium]|nr:O-antigen ligase family protein [Kordiimonadaceae bacterium]
MQHAENVIAQDLKPLKIRNSSILFVFILVPFVVDQIYGFFALVLMRDLPIALLTKAVMLVIMLVYLINKNKINQIIFLIAISILFIIPLMTDPGNLKYFMEDARLFVKLLFFPISFFFFSTVIEKGNYSDQFIYKTFRFLFYALFIAIAASIFGLGLSQYGINKDSVSIGYQGYFFAGNELAPLAVILYGYNLFYHLYNGSSLLKLSVVFMVGLFTCFLILTKVSIGGFFICTISLPIFMNLSQNLLRWKVKTWKYFTNLMITGIIIVTCFLIIFWDMIMAYFSRIEAIISRSGDIFGARHDWAGLGFDIWLNKYHIVQQLFGAGTSYQYLMPVDGGKKSVEIDPIDIILSNGIIGFSFIYGFWFIILFIEIKKIFETKDRFFGISIFLLIFSIGASFTSGHIMASSLVGFYLAIIISYSLKRDQLRTINK